MFLVKVHESIQRIIEFLYRAGFWHRDDEETVRDRRLKLFYSIYYSFLPISLVAGIFAPENNKNDQICLVEEAIVISVLLMKLLQLIWRKDEILHLLNRICDYRIDDRETFLKLNDKLIVFVKLIKLFIGFVICGISMVFVSSVVGTERTLFMKIGFPLDWRNDEFAFWTAFVFIVTEGVVTSVSILFSVLVWYMMANCGWRYEVLGNRIEKLGELHVEESSDELKLSDAQRDDMYQQDLVEAIAFWNDSNEYFEFVDKIKQFFIPKFSSIFA